MFVSMLHLEITCPATLLALPMGHSRSPQCHIVDHCMCPKVCLNVYLLYTPELGTTSGSSSSVVRDNGVTVTLMLNTLNNNFVLAPVPYVMRCDIINTLT